MSKYSNEKTAMHELPVSLYFPQKIIMVVWQLSNTSFCLTSDREPGVFFQLFVVAFSGLRTNYNGDLWTNYNGDLWTNYNGDLWTEW